MTAVAIGLKPIATITMSVDIVTDSFNYFVLRMGFITLGGPRKIRKEVRQVSERIWPRSSPFVSQIEPASERILGLTLTVFGISDLVPIAGDPCKLR